ncbi:hypothetical protein [Anaeromicropila populeti]|uniref:Uncharacterized protein n=1 Tax=Anaeromicropila populeti TaxID=37658 RepID=A0A1I6JE94_9FIRM|nr:hypothetical protein [Anaeromicropila populeti]SFR77281.1 hypothetical protein SAMN05661086_01609 [Anaeromicropila populeti]
MKKSRKKGQEDKKKVMKDRQQNIAECLIEAAKDCPVEELKKYLS